MTLMEKIKALSWMNSAFNQSREVKKGMDKPGYKTTEFWVTSIVSAWSMFGGMIPAPWNGILPVVAGAIYTIARSLAKAGVVKGTIGAELAKTP